MKEEFKIQLLKAIEERQNYKCLAGLAWQYIENGATREQAYQASQEIWLALGCDERSDVPGQDDLELLLERLWYGFELKD